MERRQSLGKKKQTEIHRRKEKKKEKQNRRNKEGAIAEPKKEFYNGMGTMRILSH